MQVNVLEAKTEFSKLLRLLEFGREESITIARNGRPVARIVPYETVPASKRIGVCKGKFKAPDDFDAGNKEIAAMMMGGDI